MNRSIKRAGSVAMIAVFAAAALFSIRLAWADFEFRRGTEDSVARAVRILPGNLQYLLLHALQMEYAGVDSTSDLERAARLSPMSSAPRLRLGLAAETRGDVKNAEKWLLDAARVDHQFEPRWTLANFYFRQNRTDAFWMWMRSALEVSYADRKPAFDLCWRVGRVDEILRRGVPQQRDVLAAMLAYTLVNHREDSGNVAEALAKVHEASDVPLLDAACGVAIEAGDADTASGLWIASGHSPAGGVWNGNFATRPGGSGFDWRSETPQGVALTYLDGRGVLIELSGRQPEAARLLSQIVLLDPQRRYRLEWTARTTGMPENTGLVWTLGDQRVPLPASADDKSSSAVFVRVQRLMPLALSYQRPGGQPRAEGWVEIQKVSLVPEP